MVRWCGCAVLCLSILGPVGPRKLLRLLSPASPDRIALLSDADRLDDVPQGVLPQASCSLPEMPAGSYAPMPVAPVGMQSRTWNEFTRAPPAA